VNLLLLVEQAEIDRFAVGDDVATCRLGLSEARIDNVVQEGAHLRRRDTDNEGVGKTDWLR